MKAIILAAGASTRLRPLTDRTPKCLLPVAGVPILRRAIETLRAAGVRELAVVTGYLEQQIHAAVREWFPGLAVTFLSNPDYASTNNAWSLLIARPAAEGIDFLLLDSDIVFDAGVLGAVLASPHADCLALRPAADLGDEEMKVQTGAGGRVVRISREVPVALAAGESIGIERFSSATSRALFPLLEERVVGRGQRNEFYEATFQELVDRRLADLRAVSIDGLYCAEIDTPADLAAAERALSGRA